MYSRLYRVLPPLFFNLKKYTMQNVNVILCNMFVIRLVFLSVFVNSINCVDYDHAICKLVLICTLNPTFYAGLCSVLSFNTQLPPLHYKKKNYCKNLFIICMILSTTFILSVQIKIRLYIE